MNHISDNYIQRLDLGTDPFAPEFSGSFFYSGASRKQLLDEIVHFTRFGDYVVMITGSTGSGTSTILDAANEQLQPLMDCCHINAQVISSPGDILEALSEQLRLHIEPPVNIEKLLSTLEACAPSSTDPEPVIVAIDQAHFMGIEGYECLLELLTRSQGSICLMLAGEKQVEELARLSGCLPGRFKVFEVPALTLSEVDEFILEILRSAGYAGNQPLSNDQLAVLHEQTYGNLADVIDLTPELLNGDKCTETVRSRFVLPLAHMVALGILFVALVFSYFYQGDSESDSTRLQDGRVSKEIILPEIVNKKPDTKKPLVAEQSNIPLLKTIKEKNTENIRKELSADNMPSSGLIEIKTLGENNNRQSVDTTTSKLAIPSKPEVDEPDALQVVSDSSATNTAVKPSTRLPSEENKKRIAQVKENKKVAPAADKMLSGVKTQPAASSTVTMSARERRMLKLPSSAYMLQLLGSVEETRTRDFVKQYIGRLPVTYIEVTRRGKPWYVVLSGPYDDKAAAVSTITYLPEKLQKQKPWVRSVTSIQADIKQKWGSKGG